MRRSHLRCLTIVTAGVIAGSGAALGALPVHAASATVTCGAKNISHGVAPGVGKSTTVAAGSAGTVTMLQNTQTNLQVQSVAPATGWTDKVTIPSGVKVHVGFHATSSTGQLRFDGRLNPAGTTLTIVTVSCS